MKLPDDILERRWVNRKTLMVYVYLLANMEAQMVNEYTEEIAEKLKLDESELIQALDVMQDYGVIEVEEKSIKVHTLRNKTNKNKTAKVTTKSIEERKIEFGKKLEPFLSQYGREMLLDFYHYWTEPNKSLSKMRFELKSTWSLEGRLRTWAKNDYGSTSRRNINDYSRRNEATASLVSDLLNA